MKTQASFNTTAALTDIAALLAPVLGDEYGAELTADDLEITYNALTQKFTILVSLDWEHAASAQDDSGDWWELSIPRGYRVDDEMLGKLTGEWDRDEGAWPRGGDELICVNRDGDEQSVTIERVDHDGEIWVHNPDGGTYSVSNYGDDDGDGFLIDIETIRWRKREA